MSQWSLTQKRTTLGQRRTSQGDCKETKITTLECAAASKKFLLLCEPPLPLSLPHYLCSLGNDLCGQFFRGQGTYTAEGITKLCERLKESAVTSLKCAAAPECSPFVNAR